MRPGQYSLSHLLWAIAAIASLLAAVVMYFQGIMNMQHAARISAIRSGSIDPADCPDCFSEEEYQKLQADWAAKHGS